MGHLYHLRPQLFNWIPSLNIVWWCFKTTNFSNVSVCFQQFVEAQVHKAIYTEVVISPITTDRPNGPNGETSGTGRCGRTGWAALGGAWERRRDFPKGALKQWRRETCGNKYAKMSSEYVVRIFLGGQERKEQLVKKRRFMAFKLMNCSWLTWMLWRLPVPFRLLVTVALICYCHMLAFSNTGCEPSVSI